MNKIQTLLITTVLLFGISGSGIADFNDGLNAYQKGDYRTAFNEWKPLAEQGAPRHQNIIGIMYQEGRGTLKNYKEAAKWYRKAAEQGFVDGQRNLGWMYNDDKDYKKAIKWYRKAAEQGDAKAQLGLGGIYITNASKDLSKAKYWIKKAYENPDVDDNTRELAEKVWDIAKLWKYQIADESSIAHVEINTKESNPNISCNADSTDQYSGIYSCKYSNGNKSEEGCYIDGKKEEWWNEWYENGNLKFSQYYNMGGDPGESSSYDENGNLTFRNNHGSNSLGSFIGGVFVNNFDKVACYCRSDSERAKFLEKNNLLSCSDLDKKIEQDQAIPSVQVENNKDDQIAINILKVKAVNKCKGCNLSGADLTGAKLSTADLSHSNLSNSDLSNVYLLLADLSSADLTGAKLNGANLSNADLSNADLTGAKLNNANLTGAIFCNTKTPWGLDNTGCRK